MKLTVEISKYPLADDYIGPIKGFIDELNKTDDVKIINQNGKLKLRMEIDTRFQGEDTYIEVYFKNIRNYYLK